MTGIYCICFRRMILIVFHLNVNGLIRWYLPGASLISFLVEGRLCNGQTVSVLPAPSACRFRYLGGFWCEDKRSCCTSCHDFWTVSVCGIQFVWHVFSRPVSLTGLQSWVKKSTQIFRLVTRMLSGVHSPLLAGQPDRWKLQFSNT